MCTSLKRCTKWTFQPTNTAHLFHLVAVWLWQCECCVRNCQCSRKHYLLSLPLAIIRNCLIVNHTFCLSECRSTWAPSSSYCHWFFFVIPTTLEPLPSFLCWLLDLTGDVRITISIRLPVFAFFICFHCALAFCVCSCEKTTPQSYP